MGDPIAGRGRGPEGLDLLRRLPAQAEGRARPSTWPGWRPAARTASSACPRSAVIDTGDRKIVYVEAEPGVFEGRKVVLGPRSATASRCSRGSRPARRWRRPVPS